MEQDYHLVLRDIQKGYVINTQMYFANTPGINAFRERVSKLEGLFVDKGDLDKMKSYLKELADDINKRYSDCSFELVFREHWPGDNRIGFEVYTKDSNYLLGVIYFIGVNSKASFQSMSLF